MYGAIYVCVIHQGEGKREKGKKENKNDGKASKGKKKRDKKRSKAQVWIDDDEDFE